MRVLRSWRMVSLLARKGAALSLLALVLLPAVSTADDFHTCALHGLSLRFRTPQLYTPSTEANPGPEPCLACYWQSVTDTAGVSGQLWVELQLVGALSTGQPTAEQPQRLTLCHGRAPPCSAPPSY